MEQRLAVDPRPTPEQILAEFNIPAEAWQLFAEKGSNAWRGSVADGLAVLILATVEANQAEENAEDGGGSGGGSVQMMGQLDEGQLRRQASLPTPTQIPVHSTRWVPSASHLKVVLNATVDTADVLVSSPPSAEPREKGAATQEAPEGEPAAAEAATPLGGRNAAQACTTRKDRSHVVVLDNLFGEAERAPLLAFLNGNKEGWDDANGPPRSKWEQATCDGEGLPPTYALLKCTPVLRAPAIDMCSNRVLSFPFSLARCEIVCAMRRGGGGGGGWLWR